MKSKDTISNESCKFFQFNNSLIIINPHPEMEKYLIIRKKSLELDTRTYDRRSVVTPEALFQVVKHGSPGRTIQTFQGFKSNLIQLAKNCGISVEFYDHRIPFPEPQLRLTHGFRLRQEELFLKVISANQSGLLQAPTRYGKSIMIINILRAYPRVKTVVTAPGVDLLGQTVADLQQQLPEREIKGIFTGSRTKVPSEDITVCSLDSLHKVDMVDTKLLLIDEPHAAVSESRAPMIARFRNARILGFGATLSGRYDNADKLITGLIGPILGRRTFKEAVKEEAICDIKVFMMRIPFSSFHYSKRDTAYSRLLYKNETFFQLVREISSTIIPKEWQTIIFIDQKKQADFMSLFIENSETVIAGRMTKKQRQETFERMRVGEIKRCICTDVYAQGVTFPDLRVMVNASGGGGSISSVQKPGRLAQIRPGKTCGYLVDFLFEPLEEETGKRNPVVSDSWSRHKKYKSLGYDISIVDKISDIELT
jgi:superfamily II DNA or RNA helicase